MANSALADYSITNHTVDCGGGRSASASYVNDASLGGIGGVSSAGSQIGRHGYSGQLTEVISVSVTATTVQVNEGGTAQLTGTAALDDETSVNLTGSDLTWHTPLWPIQNISASGVASAGAVFQDTAAAAQGSYLGYNGTLGLTVKNVNPDDFGIYAGDGIEDAWQNQYFGLNNPLAASTADPDGDGQNNQFEFTAGIVPNDPASRFSLRVEPVAGQPGQKRLVFSPRWTDRTYTIVTSSTLEPPSWSALTGGIVSDNGSERVITDTNAGQGRKFYRVQVVKP